MSHELNNLLTLMARLRDPERGCPWDIKQTFATIAPYTLEEACEVVEAIEQEDYDNLREELGDLLLQVIFHAQMASEAGYFDFADVSQELLAKLIRRHPHVFPSGRLEPDDGFEPAATAVSSSAMSAEQVLVKWDEIKAGEKKAKGHNGSAMPDNLPRTLPTMQRAEKIQVAAARVGFDWPDVAPVFDKIYEELDEIRAARAESQDRVAEEVGDLLFACVNLARHLGVDGDMALRKASHKFAERFKKMEARAADNDQRFTQLTLAEMEAYWQQCK